MIESYIARVEEACGSAKTKDYIVILRFDKRNEAVNRVLKRVKVLREVKGVLVKASCNGTNFTMFMNGRIVFKSLKDREELDAVLEHLLK